ncbi:expressed unknown protein [Seminavis robusta]|uniref:Uncharacterized protein n=1 Tax=Seminavis robusta TaxID=568900 RepID=A0A9N8HVP4_9STRA|nr:expressed unknown protein [Seminavis robusta]|eukprot:Sro2018_g311250.1 n/a (313) ;mRNA; f:13558-14593
MEEDNADANEHHGDAQGDMGTSTRNVDHQPDQLDDDSAVMDTLVNRAEAEAAQQYHDEAQQYRDKESNAKKAQVEDKTPATSGSTTRTRSTNKAREEDDEEAGTEIMEILGEQAELAMAEHVQEKQEDLKQACKTTPGQNPIRANMRFLPTKSPEAFDTTPNQHLLQTAAEIDKSAKMEKRTKNAHEATERETVPPGNTQRGETIQQTTQRRTSQPSSRPGAPEEALLQPMNTPTNHQALLNDLVERIEPIPMAPTSLSRGSNHRPQCRPGAYMGIGATLQRVQSLDFDLLGSNNIDETEPWLTESRTTQKI